MPPILAPPPVVMIGSSVRRISRHLLEVASQVLEIASKQAEQHPLAIVSRLTFEKAGRRILEAVARALQVGDVGRAAGPRRTRRPTDSRAIVCGTNVS